MNQRNQNGRAARQPASTALERLRFEFLTSGLYDFVPLAEVESVIARAQLATSTAERQELALTSIRSLLEDGLMLIGDLPHPGEEFAGWGLTIDAAMDRLYDEYVGHYDDRELWSLTIWLGLTPAGKQLARQLEDEETNR